MRGLVLWSVLLLSSAAFGLPIQKYQMGHRDLFSHPNYCTGATDAICVTYPDLDFPVPVFAMTEKVADRLTQLKDGKMHQCELKGVYVNSMIAGGGAEFFQIFEILTCD